jgi:uncharacterized integral membrane protein
LPAVAVAAKMRESIVKCFQSSARVDCNDRIRRKIMSRVIQIVFALLIIFFGLAFHIKNDAPATLDFYVRTIDMPLSWIVVIAFSIGVILGLTVMVNRVLLLQHEIRRLTRKNALANKEIVNLRAIPINDVP